MDSTTLKVQIDTNITNKIGVGSISKTDVGGELKEVVNYVDQEKRPYKVYSAILNFVDVSTITANVLENTIGNGSADGINDISWSYNSAAQPQANMTNAPFALNKTVCTNFGYVGVSAYSLIGFRSSSSVVRFYSNEISTNTASLEYVGNVYIEIRIYN